MSRHTVWRVLWCAAILLISICPCLAAKKEVVVRGFVGHISSSSQFKVDEHTIITDNKTRFDFMRGEGRVSRLFAISSIHPGLEVEVTGELDKSGALVASTVFAVPSTMKVRGTALIERTPSVTKNGATWEGVIFADGRRVKLDADTKIDFVPNDSESKSPTGKSKLTSLDQVGPNVWITYQGLLSSGIHVDAERVAFLRNETEVEEKKLRDQDEPTITEPDYATGTTGKIIVRSLPPLSLVPSKAWQQKVNEVGLSLVPEFQKALPASDLTRINFRFFVVDGLKGTTSASSNGVALVASEVLPLLQNESQLAGILASSVVSAIQEQEYHGKTRRDVNKALSWTALGGSVASFFVPEMSLVSSALSVGNGKAWSNYTHTLERQEARLALEYVYNAGYDPREVLKTYVQFDTKPSLARRLLVGNPAVYKEMREEADLKIRSEYADVTFSEEKTRAEQYQKLLQELPATQH